MEKNNWQFDLLACGKTFQKKDVKEKRDKMIEICLLLGFEFYNKNKKYF